MSFTVVKKGTRTSDSKIYISRIAKTLNFSAGFLRENNISLLDTKHVRLAFDDVTKEIAIDFTGTKNNEDESLTLTQTQTKTSASCSVNPILNTFSLDIGEIAGTYKNKAIDGPIKINGFSDSGFILRPKNREV